VAPVQIDLLSSLDGIASFDEVWERRIDAHHGDVPAHYLSAEDLIRAKEAAGRAQDRAAVETLRQVGRNSD